MIVDDCARRERGKTARGRWDVIVTGNMSPC